MNLSLAVWGFFYIDINKAHRVRAKQRLKNNEFTFIYLNNRCDAYGHCLL